MNEDLSPYDAVALFDLDNSLVDYVGRLRSDFEQLGPSTEPYIHNLFDSSEEWVQERIRIIREKTGWWEWLPRFQLGFDVLDVARKLQFENHVLTQGPNKISSAWSGKKAWCEREVPDCLVTITRQKSLVYGRVLCDDYPNYYRGWLRVRSRGLVIVPAQPWNADECDDPRIVRYDGDNIDEVEERMTQARNRL